MWLTRSEPAARRPLEQGVSAESMLSDLRAGLGYVDFALTTVDRTSAHRSLELARYMRDLVQSRLAPFSPDIQTSDYARVLRGLQLLSARLDELEANRGALS